MKIYFFLLLVITPAIAHATDLKPFTTDGCSAFPDGTLEQKSFWIDCCIRHDLAYWQGGTYAQRLDADNALKHCVDQVGEPEIARLMLAGVRVGGSPYYPTPYRWGYGWPYPRGYKAISQEEQGEVQQQLDYFRLLIQRLSEDLNLFNE